ncbi:flagellar basal-body MS-ring/collar protein FliF [Salinibacillus xinjiangensis]|uniref:flagellar basal-body MS-ring/collar protein FliF n=1 Tax=Salinibacillus xinjiangensis TaxID=1229268 RepID=UPI002B273438|nr:flagellar basal-body MS-ring/collar protein FliF [Salinibacillus xinjiangensis]
MEKLRSYYQKTTEFWKNRTLKQKSAFIGGFVFILLLIVFISVFANKSNLVPLYNNLSLQETGQIKAELDARAIDYEVSGGGTSILVPEEHVDTLLVDLAAQGLPNSGNIDYSFFSENASWGMTDGQREMIELDALQTELSNLMKRIEGIRESEVLITKPEESVFINEETSEASASIVIHTEPGYKFNQNQIDGLYHLVSKSVPNLPTDNIVLMNQHFEYFDQKNSKDMSVGTTYLEQQEIKKEVERDVQRRVQQLLGTMIGRENVVVSVTTDLDFTQENRVEEVVEPVDMENMEGLPVSVERITETYSGDNPPPETIGADGEIPEYNTAEGEGANSEYEMVKETINNEYNRIRKDIVESPYQVRDLGIQVAVDRKKDQPSENGDAQYLTAQEEATVEQSIASILDSIISTTVSEEYGNINPEEKVSIVFQEFNSQPVADPAPTPVVPTWLYAAGAALLLLIVILLLLAFRKRKKEPSEEHIEEQIEEQAIHVPDIEDQPDTEEQLRRKQLENMAKDKPEEFAKLLKTWIAEE